MKFNVDEKLIEYFADHDSVWDEIAGHYYDQTVNFLKKSFPNLTPDEAETAVIDFFVKIHQLVSKEKPRVECEGAKQNLSLPEIREKKINACAKLLNYDLSNSNFVKWMRTIVWRNAIDIWRQKIRRNEISIDTGDCSGLNDVGNSATDIESLILLKEFKQQLFRVLNEEERIYYRIWLEQGGVPGAADVRNIFQKETGRVLKATSISFLTHRFIRLIYLVYLKIETDAKLLKNAFRRFIKTTDDEDAFFDDMMRLIWHEFYSDKAFRSESQKKISPELWRRWENMTHRKKIQGEILVAAHRYYRAIGQRPTFRRTIETFAADVFGIKVKELFFGIEIEGIK